MSTQTVTLTGAQIDALHLADSFYLKVQDDSDDPREADLDALAALLDRVTAADSGEEDSEVTVEVSDTERAALRRAVETYVDSRASDDHADQTLRPLLSELD